jgi:hypothetical protein
MPPFPPPHPPAARDVAQTPPRDHAPLDTPGLPRVAKVPENIYTKVPENVKKQVGSLIISLPNDIQKKIIALPKDIQEKMVDSLPQNILKKEKAASQKKIVTLPEAVIKTEIPAQPLSCGPGTMLAGHACVPLVHLPSPPVAHHALEQHGCHGE